MEASLLSLVVLGAIQGLAEFLPISSSGHLVLVEQWLGVRAPGASLEAWLHLGTLGAVVAALGPDVARLVRGTAELAGAGTLVRGAPGEDPQQAARDGQDRRGLAWAVILGTLPAVVVGLLLADRIEIWFEGPRVALGGLLGTGGMLLASRAIPPGGRRLERIGPARALFVGLAQAVAILPGVSRSGTTIVAGLLCGVEGEAAARYSFLLSLPAVVGAMVLQGVRHGLGGIPVTGILVGLVTAFVFGVVAIRLLLPLARRGRIASFGWYCLAIGGVGFLL